MSDLYNRINALCKERNTNITQMCKQLDIARSSFSELNAGRTKTLNIDYVAKVADYLHVSTDYLLGKTDQKERPSEEGPPKQFAFLQRNNGYDLDEDDMQMIEDFIEGVVLKNKKKKAENDSSDK